MYIDTHCHITDKKYLNVEEVINGYLKSNVRYVIEMGCNLQSSVLGKNLSNQFDSVYFAVGVHPSDIEEFNEQTISLLEKLTHDNKCVAIGEIGLDYYWKPYDDKKQIQGFLSQLELAKNLKLPVSVHCRDANGEMVKILKDNKQKLEYGGVMHCYSGSKETVKELLDLGFYIGFGGTVTFKNAVNVQEVCRFVPVDRILTETDSPYLSPEPYRGQINTPENIPIINAKISLLKGIENEKMAEIVMNNAKALFYKIK